MLRAERPDFVDVITPPPTHEELCRAAAESGRARHLPEAAGTDPGRGAAARRGLRLGRRPVHGPRELPVPALAPRDQAAARRGGHRDETALAHIPIAPGRRLGPRRLPRPAALFPDHAPAARLRDGRPLHRHVPLPGGRGRAGVRRPPPAQPGHRRRGLRPARLRVLRRGGRRLGREPLQRVERRRPALHLRRVPRRGRRRQPPACPRRHVDDPAAGPARAPPRLPTRAARIRRQLRVRHAATFRRPAARRRRRSRPRAPSTSRPWPCRRPSTSRPTAGRPSRCRRPAGGERLSSPRARSGRR